MCSQNNYSPKQLAIFGAVISLLNKGESFYTLKIADIAIAAGIGKGTVYEYFKSKEDIVIGAILYNLDILITKLGINVSVEKTFYKMLDQLYMLIDIAMLENAKTFHLLFSSITPETKTDLDEQTFALFEKRKQAIISIIGEIIKQGIAEKIITLHSYDKTAFVINSALMGYINGYFPMCQYNPDPKASNKNLKKYATEIIVSCLK